MRFGWIPDGPDMRDYTSSHPLVKALLAKAANSAKQTSKLGLGPPSSAHKASKTRLLAPLMPSKADLSPLCPPVVDQGNLGSCTANAACGLVGFYQLNSFHACTPLSRLFVYKTTRELMMASGDTGATIRATMGALALTGAPPEKYWEYDEKSYDVSPPPFCYAYASNYQALLYFKHDTAGIKPLSALSSIRSSLCKSIPCMFGFVVYESIKKAVDGQIPFPSVGESVLGGHAVMACGFDDKLKIGKYTGALMIRNSWGASWGSSGYGWLPYEYVLRGLALDFWSLLKSEWVDAREFGV